MRETFVELGVIVRAVRSGDYDARLALFTAEGVKWYTIKGVYRPKAKFAGSIGMFTVAEFTINGKAITGVNVLVSPYNLAKDIKRYYLASAIADSLLRLEFVEQTPTALVNAVNAMTDLNNNKTTCEQIFVNYFTQVLHLLGYDLHTTSTGPKLVNEIRQSFLGNVDYQIQFCDMIY